MFLLSPSHNRWNFLWVWINEIKTVQVQYNIMRVADAQCRTSRCDILWMANAFSKKYTEESILLVSTSMYSYIREGRMTLCILQACYRPRDPSISTSKFSQECLTAGSQCTLSSAFPHTMSTPTWTMEWSLLGAAWIWLVHCTLDGSNWMCILVKFVARYNRKIFLVFQSVQRCRWILGDFDSKLSDSGSGYFFWRILLLVV